MERQTVHRILGVLVIAGLVIILLPLFQTKNELPSEAALMKAPSFPDQAIERRRGLSASNDPLDSTSNPIPITISTSPFVPPEKDEVAPAKRQPRSAPIKQIASNSMTTANEPQAEPTSDKAVTNEKDDPQLTPDLSAHKPASSEKNSAVSIEQRNPGTVENKTPLNNAASTPSAQVTKDNQDVVKTHLPSKKTLKSAKATMRAPNKRTSKHVKAIAKVAKIPKLAKVISRKPRKRMVGGFEVVNPADVGETDKHGFVMLNPKGWVVQLGSFRKKSNAIRLVNKLRKRGYQSFLEHPLSNKHGLTKVMVGPRHKKADAKSLVAQLESEVHLRGIVVTYKPLSL